MLLNIKPFLVASGSIPPLISPQYAVVAAPRRDFASQGETAATRITIEPSGAVTGVAEKVGCKLSEQVTPGWLFARADVEIKLRGCQHPVFNASFSGYIYANDRCKNALIPLESKTTDTEGYPMTVYVTGKLK